MRMTKIKTVLHDPKAGQTDGLVFELEDGSRVILSLDGDCCSQSTFEKNSLDDASGLVGDELRALEHVSSAIPNVGGYGEDSTQYSAVKVTTDKQVVVLDWRNESNGYYSGTCDIIGWKGNE